MNKLDGKIKARSRSFNFLMHKIGPENGPGSLARFEISNNT